MSSPSYDSAERARVRYYEIQQCFLAVKDQAYDPHWGEDEVRARLLKVKDELNAIALLALNNQEALFEEHRAVLAEEFRRSVA